MCLELQAFQHTLQVIEIGLANVQFFNVEGFLTNSHFTVESVFSSKGDRTLGWLRPSPKPSDEGWWKKSEVVYVPFSAWAI